MNIFVFQSLTFSMNFCEKALYQISRRISLPCTRRDTKSYHRSVTVVIAIFQTDFLTSGTSGSYGICEICEIVHLKREFGVEQLRLGVGHLMMKIQAEVFLITEKFLKKL